MATGDKLVNLDELKLVYDKLHIPSVQVQIPTGQWSGTSTRTYTVNATNVTADTIVDWAMDSSINYLKADLTVTPGSGTIQFSTTAIPAGTINVTLFFPGVNGEVVIQTLADVYSKSQVDQKIAQSTAKAQTPLCAWSSYKLNDVITLSDSIDNYDYIIIRGGWDHPNGGIIAVIMPTFLIPNNNMNINVTTSYGSTIIRKVVNVTSRTSMTIVASTNDTDNIMVRQIWGVKLGS